MARKFYLRIPLFSGGITQLLGPEEHVINIDGQKCRAYNLGMCSGWRFDYDSLYVCFADDGSVSKSGHVQH